MKRITRKRRLKPVDAANFRATRKQVAQELPKLVLRHHQRMETSEHLQQFFEQLKAAREESGLSLADLTKLTGMDRSAISKLENGQRSNPTIETLARYAEAVGRQLVMTLGDKVEK